MWLSFTYTEHCRLIETDTYAYFIKNTSATRTLKCVSGPNLVWSKHYWSALAFLFPFFFLNKQKHSQPSSSRDTSFVWMLVKNVHPHYDIVLFLCQHCVTLVYLPHNTVISPHPPIHPLHSETVQYNDVYYPLGCPVYLSHRMVTLFTEPQPWKWASSSSAVAP